MIVDNMTIKLIILSTFQHLNEYGVVHNDVDLEIHIRLFEKSIIE